MNDLFPVLLVTMVGAGLAAVSSMGLSAREKKWVVVSFFMHLGFACAQVPLTLSFFGGGDMFTYLGYGQILSRMMESDPAYVIPEVTALLLHNRPHLPLSIIGTGTGTGSMSALSAWTFYLLGPSKYAVSVAFAMLSMCGKIGMYRVFRANVDPACRWPAAIAALFVPSFVFWSSGVIKEAVVVAGFGWSLYGLHLWIQERRPATGGALMTAGAVLTLLIKPYILFPFALAAGSWYYWSRALKQGRVRIRPVRLATAALLGVGGIVVLGQHFPEYSVDNFASQSSHLQQVGRLGGSAFALGSETPNTLAGQFAYAPAALLTSLFRPFVFEVHNVPSFANAVETMVLTFLFLRILLTRNLGKVRGRILGNPFLVFCVVFIAAFGVAVGLSTSNMGTLSRYRAPIVPFFVVLLLVLGRPFWARSRAENLHWSPDGVPQP